MESIVAYSSQINIGLYISSLVSIIFAFIIDSIFSGKKSVNPDIAKRIFLSTTTAIVVIVKMLGFTAIGIMTWCSNHIILSVFFIAILAISPVVAGLIDSYFFLRKEPEQRRRLIESRRERAKVIKYIESKGIYDLSFSNMIETFACYFLGTLIGLFLLVMLHGLRGFDTFYAESPWIDYFEIIGAFSQYVCMLQAYGDQTFYRENKHQSFEIHLLNRPSQFLGLFCLWFNTTLGCACLLLYVIYCLIYFQDSEVSMLTFAALLCFTLFIRICCCSDYGLKNQKTNSKALKNGRWILSFLVLIVSICSAFSVWTVVFGFLCLIILCYWKYLEHKVLDYETSNAVFGTKSTEWISLFTTPTFIIVGAAVLLEILYWLDII